MFSSNNVSSSKKPERKKDSFRDFEARTKDAWDDGDDDLFMMASTSSSQKFPGFVSGRSNALSKAKSDQPAAVETCNSQECNPLACTLGTVTVLVLL